MSLCALFVTFVVWISCFTDDEHYCSFNASTGFAGLLKFVNTYKAYSKTPEPKLETADVIALVSRIIDLLSPDIQKLRIQLKVNYHQPSIETKADAALIGQVLINLVKNAMEAVAHDGTGEINIEVKLKLNKTTSISIADNGAGIDTETLARIFIPFYTTKEKGTGLKGYENYIILLQKNKGYTPLA